MKRIVQQDVLVIGSMFACAFALIAFIWWIKHPAELKVGDCFIHDFPDKESWDGPDMIYQVEEVGKKRYKVLWWDLKDSTWNIDTLAIGKFKSDHTIKQVDCPK